MKDVALHLLEVCENSIKSNAKFLKISVLIDGNVSFSVKDDGDGFDTRKLKSLFTNKNLDSRPFGNGLRLLKNDCEQSGGELKITSEIGKGTCVDAKFLVSFPKERLGDFPSVISALLTEVDLRLSFNYSFYGKEFNFDSIELSQTFSRNEIYSPKAILFAREYIRENIEKLNGGLDI